MNATTPPEHEKEPHDHPHEWKGLSNLSDRGPAPWSPTTRLSIARPSPSTRSACAAASSVSTSSAPWPHADPADLRAWYAKQRDYYREMLFNFTEGMRAALPGVIVSSPDAALYSVIDVKNLVDDDFSALDFVVWCASEGKVDIDGKPMTVLTAPMAGFYSVPEGQPNPGRTQMRVAYVGTPTERWRRSRRSSRRC